MADSKSITILMPALNEQEQLENAVQAAKQHAVRHFSEFEILIFNDGSTDDTGAIADRLADGDPNIFAFHNAKPKNLGGVFRMGIEKATKKFFIMLPGDNENGGASLERVLEAAGAADLVIPYVNNPQVRTAKRRFISRLFVFIVNLISGCNLRYYNGTVLHRTELLKKYDFSTDGFGYSAEIIVGLVRRGYSFIEVGVDLNAKPEGTSNAFRLSNLVKVIHFMFALCVARRKLKPGFV